MHTRMHSVDNDWRLRIFRLGRPIRQIHNRIPRTHAQPVRRVIAGYAHLVNHRARDTDRIQASLRRRPRVCADAEAHNGVHDFQQRLDTAVVTWSSHKPE